MGFRIAALLFALGLTVVGCAISEVEKEEKKANLANIFSESTKNTIPVKGADIPESAVTSPVKGSDLPLGPTRIYTDSEKKELTCLARNMYFEAATEGFEGWVAVANTTMNRVKSDKFPNTICKVVYDRYQFSWTIKDRNTKPADKKIYEDIYSVATLVYNNKIGDLSGGATYYHATYIKEPWWVKGEKLVHTVTIGLHKFYRE